MDRKTKRLFWQLRVALLQAGEPWVHVRKMGAWEMTQRAQEIARERQDTA